MRTTKLPHHQIGFLRLMVLLAVIETANAQVVTFTDQDFNPADWSMTLLTTGTGGRVSSELQSTGGNPGVFLQVSTEVNAGNGGVACCFKRTGAVHYLTNGPIQYVDFYEDVLFLGGLTNGVGHRSGPVLFQGGNIYYVFGTSGTRSAWGGHSLAGQTSTNFFQINGVGNTWKINTNSHPNFSATGLPIEFGFYRANDTESNGYGGVAEFLSR